MEECFQLKDEIEHLIRLMMKARQIAALVKNVLETAQEAMKVKVMIGHGGAQTMAMTTISPIAG